MSVALRNQQDNLMFLTKPDASVIETLNLFNNNLNLEFTELVISERNTCDSFILGHAVNGLLGMGIVLDYSDWSEFSSSDFTVSADSTSSYISAGTKSLKVINGSSQTGLIVSASHSFGDLSTYTGTSSGTPSKGTIGLWLYLATAGDVSSLKLRFGSSSSDYIECTGSVYVGSSNVAGKNYYTFDLDNPSTTVGTPDWTAVDYVRFEVTAVSSTFYLSYFNISKSNVIGLNGLGERKSSAVVLHTVTENL